jgi:hypothetical protein
MNNANPFIGKWRIVETELWEADDLDLVSTATLTLGRNHQGYIGFIVVQADVDYRVGVRDGLPAIEFSFEGFDEGDEITGRGWAVLDDKRRLRGRLFFHQGDDSSFVAERHGTQKRRTSPVNKALQPTARAKGARGG